MVLIRTRDLISGIEIPAHKQIRYTHTTPGGGGVGWGGVSGPKDSRMLTVNRTKPCRIQVKVYLHEI
jgi:hypothetical protein